MNNLHRELAPVSDAAWASLEDEARRTFTLHLAGRRVAQVQGPGDAVISAVGTGRLADIEPPVAGMVARLRASQPIIELTAPFTVSRSAVDSVERGAEDPDWQPVKDAARTMALAEDKVVFDGYPGGGITGIRAASPLPALTPPLDVRDYPNAISAALASLRLAGVGGAYALLLSASVYSAVDQTSDHGYPVRDHLARLVDGPIHWAPAIDGALLVSTRGGDFTMRLAQDLSIGYQSHDADSVHLYFLEALTFLVHTPEASIWLNAAAASAGGGGDLESQLLPLPRGLDGAHPRR